MVKGRFKRLSSKGNLDGIDLMSEKDRHNEIDNDEEDFPPLTSGMFKTFEQPKRYIVDNF